MIALDTLFLLVVLLLPIAAASGWYVGRREVSAGASNRSRGRAAFGESPDYFRGLNYLLNDRPDKAIEVFVNLLEVETETVETHLALGTLFRRRGEVDRAIRIHQNLVERTELDETQRAQALLELGLDYNRSGLLDRAEELFKELLETGLFDQQALRHLHDIYQQEQDWARAIEYSERLEAASGTNLSGTRAHFYCEQAQLQIEVQELVSARTLLEQALAIDRNCVRASLMLADLAISNRDYDRAIHHLRKVESQNIDFVAETIPLLVHCYKKLDRRDDLIVYLKRLAGLHTSMAPVLALAELESEEMGLEAAKRLIVDELKIRPTLRGIERMVDYALPGCSGDTREDLTMLRETTARLLASKATYSCVKCGFSGRSLHWQCPSCKSWNSVLAIHGLEGE